MNMLFITIFVGFMVSEIPRVSEFDYFTLTACVAQWLRRQTHKQ